MPLFEYLCKECEARSEILVRGSERPRCPACGSRRLVKQASAFAPLNASSSKAGAPAACDVSSCSRRQDGTCPLQ